MTDKYSIPHLEFNLAHGCNLRCQSCDHQASLFSPTDDFPDLKKFQESIDVLAKYLFIERFQFQGGEPLLNRDIYRFIEYVNQSKVAKYLSLITNGTLLDRITENICKSLDEIIISHYPTVNLNSDDCDRIKSICKRTNTTLVINEITRFQRCIVDKKTNSLCAHLIHNACSIAYEERFYALYEGFLSRCSRMPLIARTKNVSNIDKDLFRIIDHPNFIFNLENYLKNTCDLPQSCHYCLSTYGKWHPHKMMPGNSKIKASLIRDLSVYQVVKRLFKR